MAKERWDTEHLGGRLSNESLEEFRARMVKNVMQNIGPDCPEMIAIETGSNDSFAVIPKWLADMKDVWMSAIVDHPEVGDAFLKHIRVDFGDKFWWAELLFLVGASHFTAMMSSNGIIRNISKIEHDNNPTITPMHAAKNLEKVSYIPVPEELEEEIAGIITMILKKAKARINDIF